MCLASIFFLPVRLSHPQSRLGSQIFPVTVILANISTIFPIFMVYWPTRNWAFSWDHLKANTTYEITNITFGRKGENFSWPSLRLKFFFLAHIAVVYHLKNIKKY